MTKDLACDALRIALWRREFPRKVLAPSDPGSQYCSRAYQQLLKQYSLLCNMSRKGNCWDNPVAESFFHTLKVELLYIISYQTKVQTKQTVFQYVEVYYNRQRRHSSIDYQTPHAFENQPCNVS